MNAFSQALLDDVNRASTKGTLVVASAGNDGQDISTNPYYPAGYSASNLITAAATTNVDQLANFSNWSATQVQIAAPGVGILTTYPGKGEPDRGDGKRRRRDGQLQLELCDERERSAIDQPDQQHGVRL